MRALVVAEHTSNAVRAGSRSALTFARAVADETAGDVQCLLLGHEVQQAAHAAARLAPVLVADSAALAHPVADRYARVIADVARSRHFELLAAAATTFAKDIVGRAAGLLGGAMAGDVVGHEFQAGQLLLRRPMFAGNLLATVALTGSPQIVTVRPSAYAPAAPADTPFAIEALALDEAALPNQIQYEGLETRATGRPDLTEARVVVTGGRAIQSAAEYEALVGTLADRLGGATGCTRALVDAGIAPNELQVGQTGKVVAPELYIALGVSGAVQHLAGMKNARVIVAINNDANAPIFDVANYGLVADVRQVVPELIQKLGSGP
jgi:electron transfer flavoprotein alpha subunit